MLSPTTQFRCCDCQRDFKTEVALSDHLLYSTVHKPRKETKHKKGKRLQQQEADHQPTGCSKCKKTFKNMNALKQHQESVRHQPLCHIKCVASEKCKKKFQCPSAQLHHLESGKCPSEMTKTKLDAAIARNDPERIITSTQVSTNWLLEEIASTTSTSPVRSPILTPTSIEFLDSYPPSAILTPLCSPSPTTLASTSPSSIQWLSTPAGHKGCPFCPLSRTRTFNPGALRQHLSSSVHTRTFISLPQQAADEILFHCPRSLMSSVNKKKALKNFSAVSGLAQHLESGACHGGKETLSRAVEYLQKEMKAMGLGGVRLLN